MAAAGSRLNLTQCGFCYRRNEELEEPKILPCTHIHCQECLSAYFEINHLLECPLSDCKEVFEVAVDSLPTHGADDNNASWCDSCVHKQLPQQRAVVYCTQCDRKYCVKHQESHDDLVGDHRKISLAEYRAQVTQQSITCTVHSTQPYSMGCKHCLIIICVQCISQLDKCTDGTPHELLPLDELVKVLMEDHVKAELLAKEEKLEKLFKQTSKGISEFDDRTAAMVELLHTTRDEQLRLIREKYEQLEETLLDSRAKTKEELAQFMEEEVCVKWTELRNYTRKIDTVVKHTHQVDIVRKYREMKADTQRLTEEELPKLEVDNVMDIEGKGESRDVELEAVSSTISMDDEFRVILSASIPRTGTLLRSVVVPGGPLCVCHYQGNTYVGLSDSTIARVDSNYQVHKAFIRCTNSVQSIAVYRDRVYASLFTGGGSSHVWIYDMYGNKITQHAYDSNGNYCNALVVESSHMLVADQCNLKIVKFSLSGQLLKQIPCSALGRGREAMCAVDDISVLVSNRGSSKVTRVNLKTGETMWTCAEVSKPQGVVCSSKRPGYGFVVSKTDKNIKILDMKTGKMVSELTLDDLDDDDKLGLAVYDGILIVPNLSNKKLVFYKLH